jgi:hypothetical protein
VLVYPRLLSNPKGVLEDWFRLTWVEQVVGRVSGKIDNCHVNLPLVLTTSVHQRHGNELLKLADCERFVGAGLAIDEESSNAPIPREGNWIHYEIIVNILGGCLRAVESVYLVFGGLHVYGNAIRLVWPTNGHIGCKVSPSYLEYRPSLWVIIEIVNIYHTSLRRAWVYGTGKPAATSSSSRGLILAPATISGLVVCFCGHPLHCPRCRHSAVKGLDQSPVLSSIIKVKSVHFAGTAVYFEVK